MLFGVNTGLCIGIASTASQEKQGEPGAVWRSANRSGSWTPSNKNMLFRGFAPLSTGLYTNVSHPFVLTYLSGFPTDTRGRSTDHQT